MVALIYNKLNTVLEQCVHPLHTVLEQCSKYFRTVNGAAIISGTSSQACVSIVEMREWPRDFVRGARVSK